MGEEVIIVPIVLITIGAVVAWAVTNFSRVRMQERDLLSRERLTAMEKGINLPLLESPRHRWTGSPLRSGLVLVGIGLGVVVLMAVNGKTGGLGVGAIIVFAGLANLVYWQLAGKREWESKMASEQQITQAYVNYLNELASKNKSSQ